MLFPPALRRRFDFGMRGPPWRGADGENLPAALVREQSSFDAGAELPQCALQRIVRVGWCSSK
jgi:hypothetical protein